MKTLDINKMQEFAAEQIKRHLQEAENEGIVYYSGRADSYPWIKASTLIDSYTALFEKTIPSFDKNQFVRSCLPNFEHWFAYRGEPRFVR